MPNDWLLVKALAVICTTPLESIAPPLPSAVLLSIDTATSLIVAPLRSKMAAPAPEV